MFIFKLLFVFQPTGFLSKTIGYDAIKDLYPVKRWDSNFKYCLRVVVNNGSYLLQVIYFISILIYDFELFIMFYTHT